MKKKQHSLDQFEKARLGKKSCRAVKGGRKYSPAGPSFGGSFIWEGVDVRSPLLGRNLPTIEGKETDANIGG